MPTLRYGIVDGFFYFQSSMPRELLAASPRAAYVIILTRTYHGMRICMKIRVACVRVYACVCVYVCMYVRNTDV